MENLLFLFIALAVILFSCILFSNAIEWLGAKLNLSHGVTGSILAAVGTALPETMVPLVAIFWGLSQPEIIHTIKYGVDSHSESCDISMGAIIGAPFMLITLAFFLVGISGFIYFKNGTRPDEYIRVDKTVLKRDIQFFIISFSIAFISVFFNHQIKIGVSVLLIVLYALYIYKTFKEESGSNFEGEELEENLEPLISTRVFRGTQPTMFLISAQLIFSLLCLVFSAHHFVEAIKGIADYFSFPAFVISLLLAPIATELPEKFNSWMWVKGKKDTLAIGNVSGALVFQSTFPVSVGLLFTSWEIQSSISYFIFLFCILNAFLILYFLTKEKLSYKTFLTCGIFYLVYLFLIFLM